MSYQTVFGSMGNYEKDGAQIIDAKSPMSTTATAPALLPTSEAFLRALVRDVAWGFFCSTVNFDAVLGTTNHCGTVDLYLEYEPVTTHIFDAVDTKPPFCTTEFDFVLKPAHH